MTVLLCVIQICIAQTLPLPAFPPGWERIYIKNVGSFDLPPTIEVQEGKYKEFIDEIKEIKGFDATQLTLNKKDLMNLVKEVFKNMLVL